MLRRIPSLALVLFTLYSVAQEQNVFGRVSQKDIDLKVYAKDTTANAVVLYEKGDFKFQLIGNYIYLIKAYETKIKILTDNGYEHANVAVPFYHNKKQAEKVYDIHGMTHNGIVKTSLHQNEVYTIDRNENWSEKKFTLPNIKKGSIIQYSYKIKTPFFYNLDGWEFQSNIPKIYSEFRAKIPGNYYYNRSLYGKLKLVVEKATVEKDCFNIPLRPSVDCEVLTYVMEDIPAFYEDEDYMLAASNYIARLDFELATHYKYDGSKKHYTKTWQTVDKEFKSDKDIGKQLGKSGFFTKKLMENQLIKENPLATAKSIYYFVRNHFNWNKKYSIYKDVRVKDAFEERIGNIGEINISLINMLNAAGIETNLTLLSTRENGLPSKNKPAISDFNYIVAKTQINGEIYLLDATDKRIPFGMLPYRCLNHLGRVMDFKKESYWETIVPPGKNQVIVRAQANLDPVNQTITGKIGEISMGYPAIEKYTALSAKSTEEYLDKMASSSAADLRFTNYKRNEEKSSEDVLSETYEFVIDDTFTGGKIYFDPILVKWFESNPFKREARNFPIDFGYPFAMNYQVNIKVPDGYKVISIPKDNTIALANANGILDLRCKQLNETIQLRFKLEIKSAYFKAQEYEGLKQLFGAVVEAQKNTLIALEKL